MKLLAGVFFLVTTALMAAPMGSSSVHGTVANTVLSVGPALDIRGAGKALPGMNFTAVTSAAPGVPLYVGVDAGFFFNNEPKFNGELPVLGTMYYEFQTGGSIRPVLGVSGGPVFGVGDNAESARFGMLMKPGVNIRMAETVGVSIESRIGVFGSTFVYLPQVAAHFNL